MVRKETRKQIKATVNEYSEGISLTKLHNKFQRIITRKQLRGVLGTFYAKSEISRQRLTHFNRKETYYFPFNGQAPVTRAKRKMPERDGNILSMEDFMPGKKYQAYLEV